MLDSKYTRALTFENVDVLLRAQQELSLSHRESPGEATAPRRNPGIFTIDIKSLFTIYKVTYF